MAPVLRVSEAKLRVQEIRQVLAVPDDHGIALSVSVGMASFGEEQPLDRAMAVADAAMYRDKAGRAQRA